MLIDVKGWKAIGNKLSTYPVKDISLIVSEKVTEEEANEDDEISDEESVDPNQELEVGSKIDLTPKKEDEDQLGLF
jgi:topoisomerase-4 subunit A